MGELKLTTEMKPKFKPLLKSPAWSDVLAALEKGCDVVGVVLL